MLLQLSLMSNPHTQCIFVWGKDIEKNCKNETMRSTTTQNSNITITLSSLPASFAGSLVFVLPLSCLYQYVPWTVPEQTNSVEADKKTFGGTGMQEWEVCESENVAEKKQDRMMIKKVGWGEKDREEGSKTMKVRDWKMTRWGHGRVKWRGVLGEVERQSGATADNGNT